MNRGSLLRGCGKSIHKRQNIIFRAISSFGFYYREITESKYSFQVDDESILDPRSLTPVERARNKKKTRSRIKFPVANEVHVQVCE